MSSTSFGRGEFLELMQTQCIGHGRRSRPRHVLLRGKRNDVQGGDAFAYLGALPMTRSAVSSRPGIEHLHRSVYRDGDPATKLGPGACSPRRRIRSVSGCRHTSTGSVPVQPSIRIPCNPLGAELSQVEPVPRTCRPFMRIKAGSKRADLVRSRGIDRLNTCSTASGFCGDRAKVSRGSSTELRLGTRS